MAFTADGSYLSVASQDGGVYLYDAQDNYREHGLCQSGKVGGGILHMDFTEDGKYLQTTNEGRELSYWSTATCKRLKVGTAQLKDAMWATFTSVLGWPVAGAWAELPEGINIYTHINVIRSPKIISR